MTIPRPMFTPRRRFFVKKSLQSRMISGVLLAACLSFVLLLVDYYLSFGRNAGWSADMMWVFLKAQKLPMIQLVVFVFALVFVTLKLSHRVAGPLINLEQSMARVSQGDLTTRVQLRPRDELKDLRDAFNSMLTAVNTHVASDRATTLDAIKALDQISSSAELSPAAIAELNRVTALLRTLTSQFKI